MSHHSAISPDRLRFPKRNNAQRLSSVSRVTPQLLLPVRLLEVEDGALNLATILLLLVVELQQPLQQEEAESTEHRPPNKSEMRVNAKRQKRYWSALNPTRFSFSDRSRQPCESLVRRFAGT